MSKTKKELINLHLNAILFITSLQHFSEIEWKSEITKGKWTIAEIVGHFKAWDEFVMNRRIPYIYPFLKNIRTFVRLLLVFERMFLYNIF
ncbi:hypothetical protein AB3U99_11530 [Niallia sp. JL1B1071]|uniref:hypothetical protein n=1 Tax=Niallia tiangongensis TaxID=3237105 RepID=UPI0037DD42CE